MPRRAPLPLAALLTTALFLAGGCGEDSPVAPVGDGGLGVEDMLNTSPQNLVIRFERTYETRALGEYESLFSSDFRFTFSNQSDPLLAAMYGENWNKEDELLSTAHLFGGFTNEYGEFQPAASTIALSLNGPRFKSDPSHADSTAHYAIADSFHVELAVQLPGTDGALLQATGLHRMYLVRGDAARLDAVQKADSTRWYIRRWEDRTPALSIRGGGAPTPRLVAAHSALPSTWGALKAQYR